jgi:lipoate-protein ligase A
MYAVVLSTEKRSELRGIHAAHAYVLDRIAAELARHVPSVVRAGTSDLAFQHATSAGIDGPLRKFSGNSLRIKRTHVLYHGTLLYDFDLALVADCLKRPPRQPDYRAARSHTEFVANLPLLRPTIQECLLDAWPMAGDVKDWPRTRVDDLVAERYGVDAWNLHFGPPTSQRP